jgi:hypothetical protein
MECRYLAAYKVQGFSNTPDVPDVPLVELQSHKLKATLTGDTDRHCYVLDRQTAVHRLLSLRQADDENLGERLNETIQEIRKNRDQSLNFKASGALVIESCEEIEATLERLARDFGEYAVYFDAINVEEVTESFRDRAAALVSSLAISSSGHYSVEHITDGVYLVNDDGKVVYPFHASDFEGPVSIIDHFSLGALDLKPKYAEALVGDKNMRGVSTLLAESLDVSTDRLRTFLFTYIALEILIHKAFSVYEQKFVHELTSSSTVPGTARYFDRIKNVMQGKYNPVDKFTIIASLLSGESSDEHIEQFKRIKGIRDRLVHTGKYEEDSLPNIELRELLIGYLRKHLDYISQ